MSTRFTVSTDILVTVTEKGTLTATAEGLRLVAAGTQEAASASRTYSGYTRSQAYLVRRLALDLRMLSIGLMILKREYGGINPVMDATISGMYQASAAVSVLLGATGVLTRSWTLLTRALDVQGKGLQGFITAMTTAGMSVGTWAAAILVAVGAGIAAGTMFFEQASGVSRLRTEIRGLERDLKDLNSEMRDLQVTQSSLSADQAKWRYVIASLKREIELTGDPTGQLAMQLKSAEAAQQDATLAGLENTWVLQQQGAEAAKTTDQIEDMKEMIAEAYRAPGREWMAGVETSVPGGGAPPPVAQIGGELRRSGLIYAHAGEIVMQREQAAGMLEIGGGIGPVSVSISLAGANISGVEDLTGALRRGGAEAAEEIHRLELLRRRTRSRY